MLQVIQKLGKEDRFVLRGDLACDPVFSGAPGAPTVTLTVDQYQATSDVPRVIAMAKAARRGDRVEIVGLHNGTELGADLSATSLFVIVPLKKAA
jgi:poly-gamma-glutamate capsule biosynthesis protein CapA/YwtB (metallophosphatase superfamily)